MKLDSAGGHSRYNPFAEKYRASNKKRREAYYSKKAQALKMAKVDAPGAKEGIKKVVR